jgi:hypothetical protein
VRKVLFMASIRLRALSLLGDGNPLTATAISEKLGVDRNSASHSIARAYAAGDVRIVDYLRTGKDLAPVYGLGGGDDVERPAPLDPNDRSAAYRARHPDRNRASSRAWRERNLEHVLSKQAEYRARRRADAAAASPVAPVESCLQNRISPPPRKPAVTETVLQYFELDGGLLPGVRHFSCDRYKATLSVESCADKFKQANSGDAFGRHAHCRLCPIGARHAGAGADLNLGSLRSARICGRCHRLATRLIHKHTCVSCFNRARELRVFKNAKGNAPVRLARLDQRSITYRAAGVVKTLTLTESVDTDELIVATLRDSKHAPQFGYRAPAAMDWLLDGDVYDRSIDGAVDVADVAAVVDSEQDVHKAAPVADDTANVAHAGEPVAAVPGVLADPLRDLLECDERPVPSSAPSISNRAANRHKKSHQRIVRLSSVTANMLRSVGALLPAAVPATAPVAAPVAVASYSPALYSGGKASG